MIRTCVHTETRSIALRGLVVAHRVRDEVGNRRPRRGVVLVEAERDARGVPQHERDDDAADQPEDQVGLAQVTAVEALRALDLADRERRQHAREDEHREEVDEEREPALRAEPGQRRVAVDDADHRDHDRRQQHDEAPEDGRVHDPRQQPLEELLLPEHDHGLVAHALRHVVEARHGLAHAHELVEQPGPAREERRRDEATASRTRPPITMRPAAAGSRRRSPARPRAGRRSPRSRRST